jgi:hypothetical protein
MTLKLDKAAMRYAVFCEWKGNKKKQVVGFRLEWLYAFYLFWYWHFLVDAPRNLQVGSRTNAAYVYKTSHPFSCTVSSPECNKILPVL